MRFKSTFSLMLLCALISCAPIPRLAIAENKDVPADQIIYLVNNHLDGNAPSLHIVMRFPRLDKSDTVSLQLPVWSPGDYNSQNFAQNVQHFHAFQKDPKQNGQGQELVVAHSDANTWQITAPKDGVIQVEYDLPETPPGNFSENIHFKSTQTFINGPAAFMYIVGHKDTPIRLEVTAEQGWNTLVPLLPEKNSRDTFDAPDYDTFADSPILISAPDASSVRTFNVGGTTFRTIFFGGVQNIRDVNTYTPVIQRLIQAETAIMGPMPTTHYDFFFDVNGRGGGLEHLNACRIALPAFASPQRLGPFIGHEFFHLWNIKRIRPEVLGPFDYIHPPKTRNIWFAEGVTEYYAHIATRRADLYTDEELLSHFRSAIRRLSFTAARTRVTADESSLRVWETQTSEGYGGLSYYAKGELVGLCMDLKIRQLTNNRKSLDDMMRLLMQRHAPPQTWLQRGRTA